MDWPLGGSTATAVNAPPAYGSSATCTAPSFPALRVRYPTSSAIICTVTCDPSGRVNGADSVRSASKVCRQPALKYMALTR